MWHELIDHPEAWPKPPVLRCLASERLEHKTYGRPARQGWLGLVSYLDSKADLRKVCQGTAKKNMQYYLDRTRLTGDLHGQAPVLWPATALLR
jgi:unsaturated rhamnogalacturonyl hydrolase